MRSLLAIFLYAFLLSPTAVFARECDGGGKLLDYLSGQLDDPAPSVIADVWVAGGIPDTVAPESIAATRNAIELFEGMSLSPERAADIVAGDWTGWRAGLMSREEYVRLFLEEVGRRTGTHGERTSILQAAQVMQNVLDDLYGAAGGRERPEDPSRMWWWDSYLRQKAASEEIARLIAVPKGQALWHDYLVGRKTAIACALDDASALNLLAATINQDRYQRGDIVVELVAGRKIPLAFRTMAYLAGLLEYRLEKCSWVGSPDDLASVMRFQLAANQIALSQEQLFDIADIVVDAVEFVSSMDAGRADARAMDEEIGCTSPPAIALSGGIVRTVKIDASPSSDSLFVQSCSSQGLSLGQCACLGELGRGVAPKIEKMGYDRSSTIKWIIGRNPILGIQISAVCGIGDY
ncbi:MAG: hypothetical protein HXY22_01400 [Alphaproteobacteria bacterium]|nr:hypothetical protein [Alphaproteobacteria bacterium]